MKVVNSAKYAVIARVSEALNHQDIKIIQTTSQTHIAAPFSQQYAEENVLAAGAGSAIVSRHKWFHIDGVSVFGLARAPPRGK